LAQWLTASIQVYRTQRKTDKQLKSCRDSSRKGMGHGMDLVRSSTP
ncbi:unnamed protein product, partial [Ectocarpus sp. 12 AP-2014]